MPNTPEHLRNVTRTTTEGEVAFKQGARTELAWIGAGFALVVGLFTALVVAGGKAMKKGRTR